MKPLERDDEYEDRGAMHVEDIATRTDVSI